MGAVIACALAASCSTSTDPFTQLGLTSSALGTANQEQGSQTALLSGTSKEEEPSAPAASNPREEKGQETASGTVSDEETQVAEAQAPAAGSTATGEEEPAAVQQAAAGEEPAPEQGARDEAESERVEAAANGAEETSRGLLSAFFSPSKPEPVADPIREKVDEPVVEEADEPTAETEEKPKKSIVALTANTEATPMQASFSGDALPGVRAKDQLFEIKRSSDIDDTSDIDLYEDGGSYQVAAAAGLARLAPNGLLKQRESVDVSCLKPKLVHMLKTIERHFGKKVVVTSGYRSPEHNRRVRGARNSQHMYCAAADIQLEGVGKWELARFARSLPGRGGVGTYCHTTSVHVDVGPERDWNWRCRRKR
ncbi:YcbK family protein [Chelativorans sp. M5D2P16]|uniref:YcbK family protein n=1 Tax=Chelativorans sp. M5D2P16 TaxID=3095678 RepID=UPI002ACABCEF|nr:D-Ala-D-Ala carboxypeptidase family metallohydrolase [Chelativorans sp. M5D2P16]MDZ5698318.1 D-Ala-D-Ala carboxypeptidase family metallohydrolase [Chelativorans sp. M5D2P16]